MYVKPVPASVQQSRTTPEKSARFVQRYAGHVRKNVLNSIAKFVKNVPSNAENVPTFVRQWRPDREEPYRQVGNPLRIPCLAYVVIKMLCSGDGLSRYSNISGREIKYGPRKPVAINEVTGFNFSARRDPSPESPKILPPLPWISASITKETPWPNDARQENRSRPHTQASSVHEYASMQYAMCCRPFLVA